jgi:hypothetical protein
MAYLPEYNHCPAAKTVTHGTGVTATHHCELSRRHDGDEHENRYAGRWTAALTGDEVCTPHCR